MANKNQYGLILTSKTDSKAKKNIFDDPLSEDDSEEEAPLDWKKEALKKQSQTTHRSIQQKQSAQTMKKALEDDPTVFQYDELYDQMSTSRSALISQEKTERKPKYIANLLKTAEIRQREFDERQERIVQKEREAEGDLYKDKEAFVTSAYRKKMEELEKTKAEQARKDNLDALADVTKQKDLSGFYRHLYRQQVDGTEKSLSFPNSNEIETRDEPPVEVKIEKTEQIPAIYPSQEDEFSNEAKNEKNQAEKHHFRSRHPATVQKSVENDDSEDSSTDEIWFASKKPKIENKEEVKEKESGENCENGLKEDEKVKKEEEEEEIAHKISIWEKRTRGVVFDEALVRYLIRKQNNSTVPATVKAD